jgi:hypothetical protein
MITSASCAIVIAPSIVSWSVIVTKSIPRRFACACTLRGSL